MRLHIKRTDGWMDGWKGISGEGGRVYGGEGERMAILEVSRVRGLKTRGRLINTPNICVYVYVRGMVRCLAARKLATFVDVKRTKARWRSRGEYLARYADIAKSNCCKQNSEMDGLLSRHVKPT